MGLLFMYLLGYTGRLELEQTHHGANALVLDVLREIEENYNAVNLSELARRYNVSAAYLSRIIKQSTGCTFKDLLQTKRLARAAKLLRESRLSVQDIIAASGYDNTSYFYRIFKERYKTTPKSYRQNS